MTTVRVAPSGSGAISFLRWPGGKRWLVPELKAAFDGSRARYVEPFVGAGGMFFGLNRSKAILGDANEELVNCLQQVSMFPELVIAQLAGLSASKRTYLTLRKRVPDAPLERAVRFIYLNRLSFNGIYRVNLSGDFNVPYGPKPGTVVCQADRIRACARALASVEIVHSDFRETLKVSRLTDLVYLDPPYTVAHDANGFIRYNERLFAWKDQVDLAGWANTFAAAGGRIAVSNAWHSAVRELYDGSVFDIRQVNRLSTMAASTKFRGQRSELLAISRSCRL